MRSQRYPIPSFWTYLLTTAASVTLFLPAAISMNSATSPMPMEKFMYVLSAPKVPMHRMISGKTTLYFNPSHQPTIENASDTSKDTIHSPPLQQTKGSLSLQTAAIVGSSAVVAATNLISQGTQISVGYSSYSLQKLSARQSLK
jgi:hypothetical protein